VLVVYGRARGAAQNVNALVVGTTQRYKSKYITTVMYKPKTRRHKAPTDQ
jgi:hypothetical protein